MEHELLLRYGYLIVFFGVFVEGEATLIAAAMLAHHGYFNLPGVIAVAVAANVTVTQIYYQVAHWRGREAFEARAEYDSRLARLGQWVERHGSLLVLISRFLFGFRIAIPAACGASGMRVRRFFLMNLAGAAAWGLVFGLAGHALGHAVAVALHGIRHHRLIVAMAVLAVGILYFLFGRWGLRAELKEIRSPVTFLADAASAVLRRLRLFSRDAE